MTNFTATSNGIYKATMKTLILDIETRPNLAYVWGLWQQNVALNQMVDAGRVICFAAKWHGQRGVEFSSDHHNGHTQMVTHAWELVNEADAVVHYNGKAFDMKHLSREFLLQGLPPPAPHKDIDLLTVVKKQFKFPSNKLQHVSEQLGLAGKLQHSGFDLWIKCLEGDDKAWNTMRRYNIQDVRLTEQVYDHLLPWIHNHPNVLLYKEQQDGCTRCGSDDYQRRGVRHTATCTYARFRCNKCNGWFSSRLREKTEQPDFR